MVEIFTHICEVLSPLAIDIYRLPHHLHSYVVVCNSEKGEIQHSKIWFLAGKIIIFLTMSYCLTLRIFPGREMKENHRKSCLICKEKNSFRASFELSLPARLPLENDVFVSGK